MLKINPGQIETYLCCHQGCNEKASHIAEDEHGFAACYCEDHYPFQFSSNRWLKVECVNCGCEHQVEVPVWFEET